MVITQKEKTYGSQSCQKVVHGLALLYQNCSTIMKSNQEFLFKIKSCKSFFYHQVYGVQTSIYTDWYRDCSYLCLEYQNLISKKWSLAAKSTFLEPIALFLFFSHINPVLAVSDNFHFSE